MNTDGEIVIEPTFELRFDDMGKYNVDFRDGIAMFLQDSKYGFIDMTGKVTVKPSYDDAFDFSGGFTWVEQHGEWRKIDKEGNVVVDAVFEGIKFPEEDMIGVKLNGLWGYADKDGNIIIEPQFTNLRRFVDGYAFINVGYSVTKHGDTTSIDFGYWGCIDSNGDIITEPVYRDARLGNDWEDFSDGLFLIWESSRVDDEIVINYRYINIKGEVVLQPDCYSAHNFSEGLASIALDVNSFNYIFIDTEGKQAINANYFQAYSFNEGLACVKPSYDDGFGFIDKNGTMVIAPQYEYSSEFSEGLARVRLDGKYGYIDRAGNTVIPFQFNNAENFKGGIAYADGRIINKQGNVIISPPEGYSIFNHSSISSYAHFQEGLIPIFKR
jgi:hypothetical protein